MEVQQNRGTYICEDQNNQLRRQEEEKGYQGLPQAHKQKEVDKGQG